MDGSGWVTYGTHGEGSGQLKWPYGLTFDKVTEDIYISDWGNNRIVKTTISGSEWDTYGSYGYGVGEFSDMDGITVSWEYCPASDLISTVHQCGMGIKDFNESEVGDRLEFFRREKAS